MLLEKLLVGAALIYEHETDPKRVAEKRKKEAERKKQEEALRRFEKGIHYQKLRLDGLEEVPKRSFFQKKPELRKDVPAIDIRTKTVIGFWGKEKQVALSPHKQKQIKKELMKYFPDRYYLDHLRQWNSYEPRNQVPDAGCQGDDFDDFDFDFDD